MNERLAKVLEYENRLMQDRQQLQRLISESEGNDSQIVKDKLEFFAQEIVHLSRQTQMLKAELEAKQETKPQPVIQPAYVQAQNQNVKKQTVNKGDWEKTIGKSLMGIFASVLIFIGLILFATVLIPFFGNIGKVLITFTVSFVFFAIGFWKLQKDKTNKFYLSLTGCGVGALYISLLLSNMYYKVIGDIVLYLLILLWGAGVCVLSRLQDKLFQIIGHLGITISVVFGCALCMNTEDVLKFTILIIFYLITSMIFYVAHYHREILKNLIFFIFNTINLLFLVPCAAYVFGDGFSVSSLVLLVLVIVNMGLLLWSKTEEYGVSFGLFFSFALWEFWGILDNMIVPGENIAGAAVMFVIAMALIGILECKKVEGNIGKYISQGWLLFMAFGVTRDVEFLQLYGYVPLFILPVLAIGFLCKNTFFKYISMVLMFFYLFENVDYTIVHFLLAGAGLVAMYGLLLWKREQYQAGYKYILHTVTLFFLLFPGSALLEDILKLLKVSEKRGDITFAVIFAVVVAFNLVMMKYPFRNNLKTGVPESPAYHYIINMILMVVGTFAVGFGNNDFWHVLIILTTLVTFLVNSKNILDNRKNIFGGMYVGFKFTILMVVILSSFDAVNYVISIACFVLAIISIVLGFALQYKALRIFGLILSMISTFKLIMIDISYQNSMGNAISFLVSGVLCFAISLIYNLIDNRINKKTDDNNCENN